MRRSIALGISLVLAATLAVASGAVAFAGGYAVTTLDALPESLVANQTYAVGFMMRQHGITPVRDGTPVILVWRDAEALRFAARAEGAPGHYVADVTFPSA